MTERNAEICILAGGMSRRMGRDKARLRLGRKTLLGSVLFEARKTGLPVRVIRRDSVPRCGPLGGVYTALKTTKSEAVVFLACDMPFISRELITTVLEKLAPGSSGIFVRLKTVVGFPFALRCAALSVVESQIERHQFSLQHLAKTLKAKVLTMPRRLAPQLLNINTKQDFLIARCRSSC